MDMPMRGCSLWLDDERIIDRDRVIPADLHPAPPSEPLHV
jgi:hypothetical protein